MNLQLNDIISGIFAFRLINALSIKTFFQPDEYYQCLEPAHTFVFGFGYLTWEWQQGLRSSIHPLLYVLGYNLLPYKIAPQVVGAVVATVAEIHLYIFVKRYTNSTRMGQIALALSLLNPFNWYVITRAFSNSLEMALTTIALAYWPWRLKDYKKLYIACGFAFVACILRPTNAVIWLVLGLYYISVLDLQTILSLGLGLAAELAVILALSTGLDRIFYGTFTFPLYNFLEFNVIKNLSIFYGTSPWHFHLLQSIPLLLLTYLPFFIYSFVKFKVYYNILGIAAVATLVMFSLISHKEFRFLYPLMPILLLFTTYSVRLMYLKSKYFKYVAVLVVFINTIVGLFLTQVNERGEIDIIEYLKQTEDFGLLTPCHSTPWQSHLHDKKFDNSWFITCEPPLHLVNANKQMIHEYQDESDQMLQNPQKFMFQNFPPSIDSISPSKYHWPETIVIYEAFDEMASILRGYGYFQSDRIFNSYFHWDERRRGDLLIFKKPSTWLH